jgi:hypothetical protein
MPEGASTPVDRKEAVKQARAADLAARIERYKQLHANVKRRRGFYVLFIVLVLAVLALSIVDILFLGSKLKWLGVFPAYGLLLVLAILLLFSRKKHREELEELRALERSLLQCPDCLNIFRFGSVNWAQHKKAAFSCPVCGVYSALPGPGTPPVEAFLPSGEVSEVEYSCGNCGEEFAIGTFTGTPLHQVQFRSCPNCEQKGHIRLVGGAANAA